jgi:D-xylose transport system permease protein
VSGARIRTRPQGGEGARPNDAANSLATRFTLSRRLVRSEAGSAAVLGGLAVIWIFFEVQNSNFLTARNLTNLVLQTAVTAILGMGVVLVLIAGEIDLSLGSVTGASAALLGVLLTNQHWPTGLAIVVTLLFGLVIGLVQGLVTTQIGVPSFIVTLGGFLAFAGVQLALIGGSGQIAIASPAVIAIANDYLAPGVAWALAGAVIAGLVAAEAARRRAWSLVGVGDGSWWPAVVRVAAWAGVLIAVTWIMNSYFGVPYLLVGLLALLLGLSWATRRTGLGRHLYAVGGNAEAARRAGISVGAIKVTVLAASGLLAAIAAIVSASRLYSVDASTGGGTLLLEAIAAAVIGGTSLFGGHGRIYHALLGALVIDSVENGLDLIGQSESTKNIATGIILVLAVSLDALSRRRARQRQ